MAAGSVWRVTSGATAGVSGSSACPDKIGSRCSTTSREIFLVKTSGSVPPSCGSGSGALVLLDSRLFLRSSFARSVLARAASLRDAALPALPAVFMAVAMPPTVLVFVVQNHPSASLATASCRAGGTRHPLPHNLIL